MAETAQNDISLTAKQEKFIQALVESVTQEEACKKCGISRETARRWLKLSHVQSAYRDARRKVVDQAIGKLQIASNHAVTALIQNLSKDTGSPAAVRGVQIRAAQIILEQAIASSELAELRERVEQLEKLIAGEVSRDLRRVK